MGVAAAAKAAPASIARMAPSSRRRMEGGVVKVRPGVALLRARASFHRRAPHQRAKAPRARTMAPPTYNAKYRKVSIHISRIELYRITKFEEVPPLLLLLLPVLPDGEGGLHGLLPPNFGIRTH